MQRFLAALLTVVVFAAGFGARVWTEKERAVPAPPVVPGVEFNPKSSESPRGGPPRMSRAEMVATIERNRARIDVYRTRVDELDKEFEQGFLAILTPEQKREFKDEQSRRNDFLTQLRAQQNSKEILTDEQLDFARNNPLSNVLRMIQPGERTQRLVRDFDLTPIQREKTLALLTVRRDGFIKLLDETPAPSVRYSELALMVDRIANPAMIEQEKREKAERERNRKEEKK